MKAVRVAGAGAFLPNAPVANADIDKVLGTIPDAPPRVTRFLNNIVPHMFAHHGIETRHFAIDPATGRLTHTFATLAAEACRKAMASAGVGPDDIELLILSCPGYDCATPPTSTRLQQELGIRYCAEMEIHSNCSGVGKSVQVAYDALRTGRYRRALVVYAQLSSVYLRSVYFNPGVMNKTQGALRYILADGAGALVLEARDDSACDCQVLGAFVESRGCDMPPAMTAGAGAADLIDPQHQALAVFQEGSHHLDQDFTAVNKFSGVFLLEGIQRMLESLGLSPAEIAHFVVSIPTLALYDENVPRFRDGLGLTGPNDAARFRFRAARTGYCGGAAILLHLADMIAAGELKPGELVVLHSVESSKWMTAGFVLRW